MEKSKTFINYSKTIYDVCENLEDYSLTKKIKVVKGVDDKI